jgi:hypothetical protein
VKFKNILLEVLNANNLNDNFWNWFGSSKVVEDGKPLIVYHGSPDSNITVFDLSKIGSNKGNLGHYGYGFYFSTDVREAKNYGGNIYKCYIRMLNPFVGNDEQILQLKQAGVSGIDELSVSSIDFDSFKNSFDKNSLIYTFLTVFEKSGLSGAWDYVNNSGEDIDSDVLNDISDIVEYTTLNKDVDGVPDYVLDLLSELNVSPKLKKGFEYNQSLHWITNLGENSKEVTDVIMSLDYDGVMYGSEIVAFRPNQIKSINNDGSWDVNDDNIFS